MKRPPRDVVAGLDRVVAVHQHLGLDDRHEPGLLAERGVARERVRVRVEAGIGRDAVADRDHRAPLREAGAELVVLLEPLAQPVESLGHRLAGVERQRLRARVDLDPRHDALRGEQLGERRAVVGALPDRLVVEDHAADVLLHARRREEEVAVGAAGLLGRLDADRVEPLLDRARWTRRRPGCPCRPRRSRERSRRARPRHQASIRSRLASLSFGWKAEIRRTVPERERITIDSVSTPRGLGADAAQQRAARDAGSGDEDVVARDEVVGREHAVEVEAAVDAAPGAPRRCAATAAPGSRRPCT